MMFDSPVRLVAHPAFKARPGASIEVASGSTAVAAQTSSLPAEAAGPPDKRSAAPPTTAAETIAVNMEPATSGSHARSAAHPAFKARPGVSTAAASGSTEAAVQTSSWPEADTVPLPGRHHRKSSHVPPTTGAETGVMQAVDATSA